MLVKNWMSRDLSTIDVDDSMQNAVNLLEEKGINMVPVLENGLLAGVISDRDLRKASASDATLLETHELRYLLLKIKVRDIMSKSPVTVAPEFTVEETAQIMLEKGISGVPVVEKAGNVVGVITKTDVFKVLIALTGVGKRGIQFAFQLEDSSGSIKEVADIIRNFGGRMISILSSYENAPPGYRKVYIRVFEIERDRLPGLQEILREKFQLLYMVDHRENKREIFDY